MKKKVDNDLIVRKLGAKVVGKVTKHSGYIGARQIICNFLGRSFEVKKLHACYPPKNTKQAPWGSGYLNIQECYEEDNGELYVHNEEDTCQVNYCPICGYRAKIQIGETE